MSIDNVIPKGCIGIYDSGLGGLSVFSAVQRHLPHESLLYYADSFYAPYGDREDYWIVSRVYEVVTYMLSKGVKAVVIACNTATMLAVEHLRRNVSVPIIAIEPGVKVAAYTSEAKTIGVMATTGTLGSERYKALVTRYAHAHQVISQPCPGLVEYIERNDTRSAKFVALLQRYLTPIVDAGADQLVLGCTHYSFIRPQIVDAIAALSLKEYDTVATSFDTPQEVEETISSLAIVDPVDAVAQQLVRVLKSNGLATDMSSRVTGQSFSSFGYFLTSGNLLQAEKFIAKHLPQSSRLFMAHLLVGCE